MDRGLKIYMKEGRQQAKSTIKRRKVSRFKYVFMLVASFVSKLLILPAPLFIHSRIRLIEQAKEKNMYEVTHSFEDANNHKGYWTTIVGMGVKGVIILSGIVFIGGITAGLFFIGSLFGVLARVPMFGYLFAAPGAVALLAFLIGLDLSLKPLYYYINGDNEISLGKAFGASTRSMKEQGKKTLFFLNFFYYLVVLLYFAVAAIVFFLLVRNPNDSIKVIAYIAIVVFVVLFIIFIPRLGLAHDIAVYSLMKDIMINPDEADDLSLVKEKMIKQGLSKDEFLVSLFDKKLENGEGQENQENPEEQEEAKEENK